MEESTIQVTEAWRKVLLAYWEAIRNLEAVEVIQVSQKLEKMLGNSIAQAKKEVPNWKLWLDPEGEKRKP